MCGLFTAEAIGSLLIAAIVLGLVWLLVSFVVSKFPGIVATIAQYIFWALVSFAIVVKLIVPLLKCIGL